jgi:hypothetical protein
MKISRMSFDGALLERGFWIYAIRILEESGKRYLYIGRTGDNSSKNAGSPFQRIVNHLNLSPSAKANSLTRLIRQNDIAPARCTFRLAAVGPLFPEQPDFESHKPFRNRMTAVEKEVADYFASKGYVLLGKHDDNDAKDSTLAREVIKALELEMKRQDSQPQRPPDRQERAPASR